MDIMKIESKFMTGLIGKIIKKVVSSKLGYDVDFIINTIQVKIDDDTANAHVDLIARMPKQALSDLVTGKMDL